MAANTTPIFPAAPVSTAVQFQNADGTTIKSIYAPTLTNGARVVGITATNTDTAAYTFQLYLHKGSTNFLLASIGVPANSGNTNAVGPVSVFSGAFALTGYNPFFYDAYSNPMIYLDAASSLFGGMTGTVAAGKIVTIATFAEEF